MATATGENAILLLPGANHRIDESSLHALLDTLIPGDWLLLQNELRPSATRALLTGAAARQLRVVFNVAPGMLDPQVLSLLSLSAVHLLVVNEGEAAQLCRQLSGPSSAAEGMDEASVSADPEGAARQLAALLPASLHALVITLGAQGAIGLWSEEEEEEKLSTSNAVASTTRQVRVFPAFPGIHTVHDTTGAGDTFVGYLVAQLVQGRSFPRSMALAIAASGMACEQPGALPSIPALADVLARLEAGS